MMDMQTKDTWATKYRPTTLEEYVGQPVATAQVRGMIKGKRIPNVLLITGSSGLGKTTLAYIIAQMVNGPKFEQDLTDINCGSERGIESIRSMVRELGYSPRNNLRFVLLDEVQQLTPQAVSVLLKPFEKPPSHVCFILCTDQPHKLPATIRGRAQTITLQKPDADQVSNLIRSIIKKEKVKVPKESLKPLVKQVVSVADNQPRLSIQLLQTIANIIDGGVKVTPDIIDKAVAQVLGVDEEAKAIRILLAVYVNSPKAIIETLTTVANPSQLARQLVFINRYITIMYAKSTGGIPTPSNRKAHSLIQKYEDIKLQHTVYVHDRLVGIQGQLFVITDVMDLLISHLCDTAAVLKKMRK